jgi:acetylornithine aminotransferase
VHEIESRKLVARAGELGEKLLEGFNSSLHNQPGVTDIRGRGLMLGIELDRPCAELVAKALESGLLVNVTAGNVLRLLPPYILTDEEADELIRRVSDIIIEFFQNSEAPADDQSATNT